MNDFDLQNNLLNYTKSAADDLLAFLMTVKSLGVNSSNKDTITKAENEKERTKASLSKLITSLEGVSTRNPEFGQTTEKIEKLSNLIDQDVPVEANEPYHIVAQSIEESAKRFADIISEVLSRAKTSDQLRSAAIQFGEAYEKLHHRGLIASVATEDIKAREEMKNNIRDLGGCAFRFVDSMRIASGKTASDQTGRLRMNQAGRDLSSLIAQFINVVKEGGKSALACQTAISNIGDYIIDIESVLIFASAGQLDPIDSRDSFMKHREAISTSIKQLAEIIKAFTNVVKGNQEDLSQLASSSVANLYNLKENIKRGATSISSADKNMQTQMLTAFKTMAENLQGLLNAGVNVIGTNKDEKTIKELTDKIKTSFGSISELVKLVKTLTDESSRGARALESTVQEIKDLIKVLESDEPAQGSALPEEVAMLAKQLASASANLVASSSGKQMELVSSSNSIKKTVENLLRAGKASIAQAPQESREAMFNALKSSAQAMGLMLETVRKSLDETSGVQRIDVQNVAKEVAMAVSDVVSACNSLIPGGYVDPNDPNVIAERELLAAASAIEAAAKKLASLAPPPSQTAANEELTFDAQILEAAKAIAAATGALVRSATSVQREIASNESSKTAGGKKYHADDAWQDGLVSAAKQVAAATFDLCETANAAVKGDLQHERVIVCSRAVSVSTTQLLTAATVKADPNSQNQMRLKAAGKAVTNATEQLVKAAEEAMTLHDTSAMTNHMIKGTNATGAKILELEAQMNILKMEKELERARAKLASVRKGRYQGAEASSPAEDKRSGATSRATKMFEKPVLNKTPGKDEDSARP